MTINEKSYRDIIENLSEGLYFVDKDRTITYWNRAAERISGFSAAEVVGKKCSDNILTHVDENGKNLCFTMCPLKETIEDGLPRDTKVYLHNKNGQRIPVAVRVNPVFNDQGEVTGGVELFSDLSSGDTIKKRILELEKMALVDTLTGLPNRRFLDMEMERKMMDYKNHNVAFGLLFIDIDHFKNINDTYGHDTGDEIIKLTAGTILSNARPFDSYGRWGGEEFMGIIPNINVKALESLGERLRMLIENSYIMNNDEKLSVTASIGGTVLRKGDTDEDIIKRADRLMYEAKTSGRNRFIIG